jgi:hypothetical protein
MDPTSASQTVGLAVGLAFGLLCGLLIAAVTFYEGQKKGRNESAEDYKVITYPIHYEVQTLSPDMFETRYIQIGYYYQVFVKDMPGIRSPDVFLDTIRIPEVDAENIAHLVTQAVEANLPVFANLAAKMGGFHLVAPERRARPLSQSKSAA